MGTKRFPFHSLFWCRETVVRICFRAVFDSGRNGMGAFILRHAEDACLKPFAARDGSCPFAVLRKGAMRGTDEKQASEACRRRTRIPAGI